MDEVAEQKFNQLGERLKIIELVLKSPSLNKITENTGIEEKSLRDYKSKIEKKMIGLLK